MKSLTEQVHEYICKNDTQFSSEELANMVRYFTQEQEKEIEALKDKLGIEKSRLNLNIQAISKIKEQAKEIEVLNQSYEILFKHRIEQEKENQFLKKEIKDLRQIVEGTIKQAFYEDDYHKLKSEYDLLKADLEVKKASEK
jgi:hypothetical protein